tara:strand:+ start:3551 stop:4006 length:456 start_codon:yes stop_codon:yes gene_type:complete
MDPWYESSSISEEEAQRVMQQSEVYLCLHKEANSEKENAHLKQAVSSILKTNTFQSITYASIRSNPNWKTLSDSILREELITHKPYGSWRGFTTFVIDPLRKTYIIRIIREVWAAHILHNKFTPLWLKYNYSPDNTRHGYQRVKKHYYSIR